MITELLLRQLAKERNMDVSEQVRLTVERIKTENNIESDEELKRLLQNQGYDYNLMLKQMEETFLMQSVVFSEVDRTIAIDDSEIIEYYKLHSAEFTEPEEFRLRAIYLSPENKTGDELEAKKKEIEDKIQAGEDFGVLAGNYSEGPAKESQGDLGTFKKGELDKSLEQAVALLKQGEITPWIQSRGGWYLVRIEEKKESRLLSFEEAKKTIEEKIFNERKTSKLNEFLKELKQKSYIKIVNSDPLKISGQEA
jgi:parvulin-like peptidyl-prolyl isomerase